MLRLLIAFFTITIGFSHVKGQTFCIVTHCGWETTQCVLDPKCWEVLTCLQVINGVQLVCFYLHKSWSLLQFQKRQKVRQRISVMKTSTSVFVVFKSKRELKHQFSDIL